MHSFRSVIVAVAPTLICATVGAIWLSSYRMTVHFARTIGTSHYQISCGSGRLTLIRNAQWWRVEDFHWDMEQSNPNVSPVEWPGFYENTIRRWIGFEYSSGKYLTSFTRVGNDTEFIPPFKPVQPGTMLRVTTKFKMLTIPLSCVMLATMILPITRMSWGIRGKKSRTAWEGRPA
jgi:hypothetical protein